MDNKLHRGISGRQAQQRGEPQTRSIAEQRRQAELQRIQDRSRKSATLTLAQKAELRAIRDRWL